MADYQIFTPPREPLEEELGEAMVEGMLWQILNCSAGDIQYQNRGIDQHLVVRLLYKDPAELYDYNFIDKTWRYLGGDAVDISTVDMTFPEDAVTSGTKMPYFNIFAFEKDTIACKLAAVEDAKLLIKNSIINRGVGVPDNAKFREYAWRISGIYSIPEFKIFTDEMVNPLTFPREAYQAGELVISNENADFKYVVLAKNERIGSIPSEISSTGKLQFIMPQSDVEIADIP